MTKLFYFLDDGDDISQAATGITEISPPITPSTIITGPYIPISECISGKPIHSDTDLKQFYLLHGSTKMTSHQPSDHRALPSPSNSTGNQIVPTPPAVNRELKPGRKCSDSTDGSNDRSPILPLAHPPNIDRKLKPAQLKKIQDALRYIGELSTEILKRQSFSGLAVLINIRVVFNPGINFFLFFEDVEKGNYKNMIFLTISMLIIISSLKFIICMKTRFTLNLSVFFFKFQCLLFR